MLKQTLTGSKENEGAIHSFGQSIFVDEDCLLVGADDAPVNGYPDGGIVYRFEKKDDEWIEVDIIQGVNTTEDAFYGWDVAKDGNTIVIGADDEDTYGYCAGAVYVYERDTQTILTGNRKPNSYFGYSVDVQGNLIVVGEPAYRSNISRARAGTHPAHGCAYVFEQSGGTWYPKYIITPLIQNPYGFFGGQVKIWNDFIVVSEQGCSKVHIYSKECESQALTMVSVSENSYGKSLCCKDEFMFVGSLGGINIYVDNGADNLVPIQKIQEGNQFGYAIDYDDGILVVSDVETDRLKYGNIEETNDNRGTIYVYEWTGKSFEPIKRFMGEGVNTGHQVKIFGGEIFVTSPHENNGKGKVWVYEIQ